MYNSLSERRTYQMADIPRLSRLERVILEALVTNGESYGLELVKNSEGQLKRGTIYVYLHRMEEKGYVESRKSDTESGENGRRRYRATGHGAKILHAWEMAESQFLAGGLGQ